MFRASLGYPTRAPHGGRSILVGGLLIGIFWLGVGIGSLDVRLIPIALLGGIGWILVRGYYMGVLLSAIGWAEPIPPKFHGFGWLFECGIKQVLITLVYLGPPISLLAVIAGVAHTTSILRGSLVLQSGIGMVAVAALFFLLWAVYCVPLALGTFVYSGSIRSALQVRQISAQAFSEDYIVAWTIALGVQVFLVPLSYLLYPILIGIFLRVYLGMTVWYLYGRGITRSLDVTPADSYVRARETILIDDDSPSISSPDPDVIPVIRPLTDRNDVPSDSDS